MILISVIIGCAIFGVAFMAGYIAGRSQTAKLMQQPKEKE